MPYDAQDPNSPLVVVFGAGITGLTVAHELIERGFRVHVLEPTPSRDRYGCCDVGGMARSQYGHLGKRDRRSVDKGPFRHLPRAHGTPQIFYFAGAGTDWDPQGTLAREHIANDWTEPTNEEKLTELMAALKAMRRDYAAAGEPETKLRIIGHTCDSHAGGTARELGAARARAVEAQLRARGLPDGLRLVAETRGSADPNGDNNHPAGRARNNRVSLEVDEIRVPGEHGYRFYPAFYHNLDDQLRRIPVYDDRGNQTYRCVLDNLRQAESARFAVEDGGHPIRFERRLPRSFEELRLVAKSLADRLKFPPEDVAFFELKMLKFMTSCSARRFDEYQRQSWWDYVEGPRYAKKTQRHLRAAPQALVAMEAEATDAYTAGNIYVQLLLDHLSTGTRVDRTMNAPTSEAWLRHWKRYLRLQGVKFVLGALEGVEQRGAAVVPIVRALAKGGERADRLPQPEPVFADEPDEYAGRDTDLHWEPKADYYVLALPAEQARNVLRDNAIPDDDLGASLRSTRHYDVGEQNPETGRRKGPLRDFVGIQFYFEHDITFTSGHTYYPDSDWGLSSISQLQFWKDRRTRDSRYLGVLSVDIGNMVEPDRSAFRERVMRARRHVKRAKALARAATRRRPALPEDAVETVRAAVAAAGKARKALVALIEQVPLQRSTALHGAIGSLRAEARAFVRAQNAGTGEVLKVALARAEGQGAGTDDAGMRRLLLHVMQHVDAVVAVAPHAPDVARHLAKAFAAVLAALRMAGMGESAWHSSPDDIARAVWRQIKLGQHRFQTRLLPNPAWYHIDDCVEFTLDQGGKPVGVRANASPFHINPVGDFERRPGRGLPPEVRDGSGDAVRRGNRRFYEVANGQWVVAGMFTKTYTRLATMELAVESGRHAVNAILDDMVNGPVRDRPRQIAGDMCRIHNPERHELADLAFLKRIDRQLWKEGLPHFIDIVGIEDAVLALKTVRERGRLDDNPLERLMRLVRVGKEIGQTELGTLESMFPAAGITEMREQVGDVMGRAGEVLRWVFGPIIPSDRRRSRRRRPR